MSIETLRDIDIIDGFAVMHLDGKISEEEFAASRTHIIVNHGEEESTISFKIQTDPIGLVGVNGCQMTALIEAAKLIITGLNKLYPCRENSMTITKLDEALMWQQKRTIDRLSRGVEGQNKV